MFTRTFALGLTLVFAIGCDGESTEVDCSTVKGYSEIQGALAKCTTCHHTALTDLMQRGDPPYAPLEYNYDTYDEAKKFPDKLSATLVEDAAKPMPPATDPQLTAQEHADLLAWAECGTPQ